MYYGTLFWNEMDHAEKCSHIKPSKTLFDKDNELCYNQP